MKTIGEMNQSELAAHLQTYLSQAGIQVILSGGTAVSFYSGNQYVSKDIDLIQNGLSSRKQIEKVMSQIGFQSDGRYFRHPETGTLVEFPAGPLSVGEQLVKDIQTFSLDTGMLYVISATDCVKDRLCAYYYWNDLQGLAQAVLVAKQQKINMDEIRLWSIAEGQASKFIDFEMRV